MALPLVLIMASLLLSVTLVVWRSSHDDIPRGLINLGNVQANFLAKGALQHALLKIRLLPTQAYDAAAYSVGKNPYFNHCGGTGSGYDLLHQVATSKGSAVDPQRVRGPAFLTGNTDSVSWEDQPTLAYLNSQPKDVNLNGTTDAGDHVDGNPTNPFICDQYLLKFASDIRADSTGSFPVRFKRGDVDPVTGIADPFDASYSVSDLTVLALGKGRKYSEEGVRIVVKTTVSGRVLQDRAMQDRTYTASLDTIVRVSRSPK